MWNLLVDLPGDGDGEYLETLALLPLLHHLAPPLGVAPMALERFSPYHSAPAAFGITNVRPTRAHADAFPTCADLGRLAYGFEATYDSAWRQDPALEKALREAVGRWRSAWSTDSRQPPALALTRLSPSLFLLRDTRGLRGTRPTHVVGIARAAATLSGGSSLDPAAADWAIANRVAVRLDGRHVPLAVAEPHVMREFDGGA